MIPSKNNFTYPKTYRLRSQRDFDFFFDNARSKSLGVVKTFFYKNPNNINPRIGISVSKKFFNSVQRNSLKRLIREFFRTSKFLFLNMDLVISIRYSKELMSNWNFFLLKVKQDLKNLLASL